MREDECSSLSSLDALSSTRVQYLSVLSCHNSLPKFALFRQERVIDELLKAELELQVAEVGPSIDQEEQLKVTLVIQQDGSVVIKER